MQIHLFFLFLTLFLLSLRSQFSRLSLFYFLHFSRWYVSIIDVSLSGFFSYILYPFYIFIFLFFPFSSQFSFLSFQISFLLFPSFPSSVINSPACYDFQKICNPLPSFLFVSLFSSPFSSSCLPFFLLYLPYLAFLRLCSSFLPLFPFLSFSSAPKR